MTSPAAAGNHRLVVLALMLCTGVTAVVSSLGAPLVPVVASHFEVRLTSAQWSLTATLLAGALATPVLGRYGTGDRRRATIVAVLAATTAGTVLSILAVVIGPEAFWLLLVSRAMQGIGIGLLPLAVGVARDLLQGATLERTVATLSVTVVAGAGLGYPVTALAAELGGLGPAYALGAVMTGLTWLAAARYVPAAPASDTMTVDWVGAAVLGLGMAAVLVSITEGSAWGWDSYRTLSAAGAGFTVLGAWAVLSLRRRAPLVDLRLAVHHGVAAPNVVALVAGVGMYALLTLSVVLVQADDPGFGLGLSVTAAGVLLVPYSLLSIAGSRLAQVVKRHFGHRLLLPSGCVMFLSATVLLGLAHADLEHVLLAMAIGGVGSGFTFASMPVLIVPHVPREETSSAIAFNQLLRALGFTLGSAVGVALMSAYGGGASGFTAALLTLASVWVLAGLGALWLDRGIGRAQPV